MWKQMAISSLIPLGIAFFIFVSIRSFSDYIFMALSVETIVIGNLIICFFYFRPRYLADKAAAKLGIWKLVAILSVITAGLGLLIPFIPP